MRTLVLAVLATSILAECAPTFRDPYRVQLAARDGGAIARDSVPAGWSEGGRTRLDLDGKTYTGEWFYIRGDEAALVERWGAPERWSDTVSQRQMTGTVEMLLVAEETDKLRCQLRYDRGRRRGTGVCKALDGGFYDIRIDASGA